MADQCTQRHVRILELGNSQLTVFELDGPGLKLGFQLVKNPAERFILAPPQPLRMVKFVNHVSDALIEIFEICHQFSPLVGHRFLIPLERQRA